MNRSIASPARRIQAVAAILLMQANLALAVEPPVASTVPQQMPAATAPLETQQSSIPFAQLQHPSRNPIDAYRGKTVPPPSLANSIRLDTLVRDGKIYLSLRDAIDLALENNLDIVIARYNLPIAQMDIQRTRAGGSVRGVAYRVNCTAWVSGSIKWRISETGGAAMTLFAGSSI